MSVYFKILIFGYRIHFRKSKKTEFNDATFYNELSDFKQNKIQPNLVQIISHHPLKHISCGFLNFWVINQ